MTVGQSTAEIAEKLKNAKGRQASLSDRIIETDREANDLQLELGRAVGHGDGASVQSLRKRIRTLSEEHDSAERGLQFLAGEIERLEGEKHQAEIADAAAHHEESLLAAVEAIASLRELVVEWCRTDFLRLEAKVSSLCDEALQSEKQLAHLRGTATPILSDLYRQGWAVHTGLAPLAQHIRAYAEGRPWQGPSTSLIAKTGVR